MIENSSISLLHNNSGGYSQTVTHNSVRSAYFEWGSDKKMKLIVPR